MSDNPKLKKNGGEGTNIGNALRWIVKAGGVVAPEILDLAAKAIGVGDFIKLGDLIRKDPNLPAKEKEMLQEEINFDIVEMTELTKRLEIDNEHPITRLVRPILTFSMFLLFLFVTLFDGNIGDFSVNELYIPVIQDLFGVMVVFYFGSRGIEKLMREYKKK